VNVRTILFDNGNVSSTAIVLISNSKLEPCFVWIQTMRLELSVGVDAAAGDDAFRGKISVAMEECV
jgi:hypothetical protein